MSNLEHELMAAERALAVIEMKTDGDTKYGAWWICFDPPPIPYRGADYSFWHIDYDGPEDRRCGHAESIIDAMMQINALEDEAFSCDCTAAVPGECMAITCIKRDDANARWDAYEVERAKFVVGHDPF